MTTHRPPAEARGARPGHGPDRHRASFGRLLRAPLRRALGILPWCPAPVAWGNPLVSSQIRANSEPSQPSSLLLLSVVEEIIGFRGPDAFSGRARPAAAAGRPAAGREQRGSAADGGEAEDQPGGVDE